MILHCRSGIGVSSGGDQGTGGDECERRRSVAAVEEEDDDSSLNLSADISLDSGRAGTATPSQDSEILESGMARDNPSCDLSTDAEYVLCSSVHFI